jgi:large subunit ribosomal protein L44e
MKKPSKIKRYCPYCKIHTTHNLDKVKKRKASELKKGQRRFRRVTSGYRGFPRPKPEGREKTTRRTPMKFKCSKCGKSHQPPVIRARRVEIGE